MVWKFIDPANPEFSATYERVSGQIALWWQSFEKERVNIERYLTEEDFRYDLEGFVEGHLQPIDPNIMWEVDGSLTAKEFFFIMTPESERHLRPLVESIVEAAPKVPNWRFFTHRFPRNFGETDELLLQSTGIGGDRILFKIEPFEGNSLELAFAFPGIKKLHDMTANQAAFTVTEQQLGEEILDKWIGSMVVEPAEDVSRDELVQKGFQRVMNLPNAVKAAIDERILALPNAPIFEFKDKLKWTGFSLEAQALDDYAEQFDMMAATSVVPDVWKAAHGGAPFDSIRFSKFGERFCYLKMDGTDSYANSAQSRDRLATTLDERLIEAELGCTTGGAGGLRYSYIELALVDVKKALPIIKDVMAYEHMPERSWLLFWDIEWSKEWVGMFATTPAPLMTNERYPQ